MKRSLVAFVAIGILAIAYIAYDPYLYRRASYALVPTAQKALSLGQAHFRSGDPARYDIEKATAFFEEAYRLDPEYPQVNHELARVAFLRGDFDQAMRYINKEIEIQGPSGAASYYVRGLILGFMGDYDAAIKDYEHYLSIDPNSWAAINDYAWVLLKSDRAWDAARVTGEALNTFPDNAWLLNTNATALYEIGDLAQALIKAHAALEAARKLTPDEWLVAYPGNDPRIGPAGVKALIDSAINNVFEIERALTEREVE